MEACSEKGIPVWILDRPNPVGRLPFDGPVLKEKYFTFVGGASIPLCHRMTIGEMALWIKDKYYPGCDLNIIWMKDWRRNSCILIQGFHGSCHLQICLHFNQPLSIRELFSIEALNISEGRGTTIPFEFFGAPFIDSEKLKKNLDAKN